MRLPRTVQLTKKVGLRKEDEIPSRIECSSTVVVDGAHVSQSGTETRACSGNGFVHWLGFHQNVVVGKKCAAVLLVAVELLHRRRVTLVHAVAAASDVRHSAVERAIDVGGVVGPIAAEILVELGSINVSVEEFIGHHRGQVIVTLSTLGCRT